MRLRYQPALDGLRGIALGGVLLAHGLLAQQLLRLATT